MPLDTGVHDVLRHAPAASARAADTSSRAVLFVPFFTIRELPSVSFWTLEAAKDAAMSGR